MQYTIEALIDDYCDEGLKEQFYETAKIMENFEIEEFEDIFDKLAMVNEMYDKIELRDKIYNSIYDCILYVLDQHGIRVMEDTSLRDIITIADALYKLQASSESDTIMRIVETDLDPIEKFSSLVNVVSSMSVEKMYVIIDSIPDRLMKALAEVHKARTMEDPVDPQEGAYIQQIRLVKKYMQDIMGIPEDKVMVFKLVKQGCRVGGEFAYYYDIIKAHFYSRQHENMAAQMFALLYMGKDTQSNVIGYWRAHNSDLIDDMETITKMDKEIMKHVSGFTTWVAGLGKLAESI